MKQRLTKYFLLPSVLVLMILDPGLSKAETTVPHTFTAGTTARADEVNANFNALSDAIDGIPSPDTAEQVRSKFFSAACEGNDSQDIMVRVGPLCVDKYEARVVDGNSIPVGFDNDNYPCDDNGNDCSAMIRSEGTLTANPKAIFARSVAGVNPARFITWFQAQQACFNSGKRLLTNAEWQAAAAGTPDPGTDNTTTDCAISSASVQNTGSRTNCVSNWGVNDMVGNLWEWVADWMQDNSDSDLGSTSTAAFGSDGIFGIDEAAPGGDRFPAALFRGGNWSDLRGAGVFALDARFGPSDSNGLVGFRCAR